jgi:hypothetical protein
VGKIFLCTIVTHGRLTGEIALEIKGVIGLRLFGGPKQLSVGSFGGDIIDERELKLLVILNFAVFCDNVQFACKFLQKGRLGQCIICITSFFHLYNSLIDI